MAVFLILTYPVITVTLNFKNGAKKNFTFTELGTFCTDIFKIIFPTFFKVRLIGSIEVKTLLHFRFLIFHAIIRNEIL